MPRDDSRGQKLYPVPFSGWSDWIWSDEKSYWYAYRYLKNGDIEYDCRSPGEEQSVNEDSTTFPQVDHPSPQAANHSPVATVTNALKSLFLGGGHPETQPQIRRAHSAPVGTIQLDNKVIIQIFDVYNGLRNHVALLDSGNDKGMMVGAHVVDALGYSVIEGSETTEAKTPIGIMKSKGKVFLTFKLPQGTKTFSEYFNVCDMHAFDVIFDLRFLLENRVFDGFNIGNLLPLAEAKKESLDDQQQRHEAEDAQKQGSKSSAERKERSKNRRGDSRKDARRESVHRRH